MVHCNDGMSRAPSLVIAYLMETYGIDFKAALNHVQQRRLTYGSYLSKCSSINMLQILCPAK